MTLRFGVDSLEFQSLLAVRTDLISGIEVAHIITMASLAQFGCVMNGMWFSPKCKNAKDPNQPERRQQQHKDPTDVSVLHEVKNR